MEGTTANGTFLWIHWPPIAAFALASVCQEGRVSQGLLKCVVLCERLSNALVTQQTLVSLAFAGTAVILFLPFGFPG